jgi:tetratricopeptide (TPR) repeat protein
LNRSNHGFTIYFMKETLNRGVPFRSKASIILLKRCLLPAAAAFFFLCAAAVLAGCGHRVVRVPVSMEDLLKANAYTREGNEAYKNEDYYAALIKYLMAGEANPNSEYISNYIGIAYLKLQYPDKAIEAFQRSIALNSKIPSSYNNLGSAYFAGKNYKKAEKYYKKAIKMKREEASFYLNLGQLYFETKKQDKAIQAWRKGLSLDPELLNRKNSLNISVAGENVAPKDRYFFMARIYAVAGDIPKTIESLENALMNGFSEIEQIQTASEFDSIRRDKRFLKFMESATVWTKPN